MKIKALRNLLMQQKGIIVETKIIMEIKHLQVRIHIQLLLARLLIIHKKQILQGLNFQTKN